MLNLWHLAYCMFGVTFMHGKEREIVPRVPGTAMATANGLKIRLAFTSNTELFLFTVG